MYGGSKDPLKHLETFKTHMTFHVFPSEITCRVFSLYVERHSEGVIQVTTPEVDQRARRASAPNLDTIYGEQEEETIGSITFVY